MRYKENWEQSKARLMAYWNQEVVDRCCFTVYAAGSGINKERRVSGSDEERIRYWTDPEQVIKRNRHIMENTFYGGEALPQIFVDLGAGGHAGFFKGAKHYFGDSVWFFPSLESPADLEFDENSYLFQKTLELARAYVADSQGDYFVSCPDSTGNIDALSHLMGPDRLMEAMVDEPEAVDAALLKIEAAYERVMGDVVDIVRENNQGGSLVGWMSTWAPGRHAQMQSDMSVMFSNAMFERFVMPELEAQCAFLDYPIYHFDGIEQIRHLDSLLSLKNLRAIQWTQVTGQPPATDYIPQLQRIQKAGKSVLIHAHPLQIEPLMTHLSSKGLYLLTSVPTREQAEALIKMVEKLTHD